MSSPTPAIMFATIPCAILALCLLSSTEAQSVTQRSTNPNPPPAPVFRSGTRLVEGEVVVRDQNSPITGLTRDGFTLLDAGKRQEIAVFHLGGFNAGPVPVSSAVNGHRPPADAFSNRADHAGHSINGATVLLLDQLNTAFDNQGYARSEILKFLESHQAEVPVAIYLLGKNLTVIQDFTDDHDSLTRAVRKWNPENLGLLIESKELMDATDRTASSISSPIYQLIRNQITREAVAKIAQHLSGMPGRKSLVWVSDTPGIQGVQFLRAADIHLYPVLKRGVGSSGVVAWMRGTREMGFPATYSVPPLPPGNELCAQRANAALAAANGGTSFMDSRDISLAVRTALEDAGNAYVLGFYHAEKMLDDKFHLITVSVGTHGAAHRKALEIHHRPGYFASTVPSPAAPKASLDDLLRNPLDGSPSGSRRL